MHEHSTVPGPVALKPGRPSLENLDHRPIGTNGYVSTWGAKFGVLPPGTARIGH